MRRARLHLARRVRGRVQREQGPRARVRGSFWSRVQHSDHLEQNGAAFDVKFLRSLRVPADRTALKYPRRLYPKVLTDPIG